MTAEQFYANERKTELCIKARWTCQVCGKHLTPSTAQLAHRIPKHKKYLKRYGKAIIHHPLNMVVTCAACNSSVLLDPATHPIESQELIERIKEAL